MFSKRLFSKDQVQAKLLERAKEFSSDLVTLPNILLAYWSSAGLAFQLRFPLDTADNINEYAYSWLRRVHHAEEYADRVTQYFVDDMHRVDLLNHGNHDAQPTRLMRLVWRYREDLQKEFTDIDGNDTLRFWRWWLSQEENEYRLPYLLPIDMAKETAMFNENHHKIIDMVWAARDDLQAAFPDKTRQDLVVWWDVSGVGEYFGSRIEKHNNDRHHRFLDASGRSVAQPTHLMSVIWRLDPDLQLEFPDIHDKDRSAFWVWWLGRDPRDYGLSTILPRSMYLGAGDDAISISQVEEIVWSNRPDLIENFPEASESDSFRLWWAAKGIIEYSLDYLKEGDLDILHNLEQTQDGEYTAEPTFLMKLIWSSRKELRESYPDIDTSDRAAYWGWWINNIKCDLKVEYVIPEEFARDSLSDDNKKSLLKEIVWDNNKWIRGIYPDPLSDDMLIWWETAGLFEYFPDYKKSRRNAEYHLLPINSGGRLTNLPTALMVTVWRCDPALQMRFPDVEGQNRREYWRWWFNQNSRHFNLDSLLPGQLICESLNREHEDLLLKLLWDSSEMLQNQFPNARQNPERFLLWCRFCGSQLDDVDRWIREYRLRSGRVALIGHPSGMFGLGEDARLITEALREQGVETDMYSAGMDISTTKISPSGVKDIKEYDYGYICNIFCLPAFDMLHILLRQGEDVFTSGFNVAIWQWELEAFPREAKFAFDITHAVFSISAYSARGIGSELDEPVGVIRLPVKDIIFEPKSREEFKLPLSSFIYFFSFDGNSFIARKNPLGLVEAFQRAFVGDEDVRLVLKVINSPDNLLWLECARRALVDSRIVIIEESMDKDTYLALLDVCDVVVSLHRAEGFGRVIAEAFLLKKPVIASAYSGNLEFMNGSNSYLVRGNIVPVHRGEYLFHKGMTWYEPDINDAANKMYEVYRDRSKGKEKGVNGRRTILAHYSMSASGKDIMSNLYHFGLP